MVHARKLLLLIAGFALLLMTVSPVRARGWELLSGRVQEILREGESVRLTLKPEATAKESSLRTLELPADCCPETLEKGSYVRIWSKTSGSGKTVYKVSADRRFDPTGVRLRLRKHGHHFGGRRGGRGGHGGR